MKDVSSWRIRRVADSEYIQPQYSEVFPQDEPHLGDIGKILKKRRRIILILFLINFSFGVYFALSTTKLYTAAATIKIEPRNPQVTEMGAVEPPASNDFYDYHETQFALMGSRRLIAHVINDLGLESNRSFTDMRIDTPNPLGRIQSWLSRIGSYFASFLGPLFKSNTSTDENIASDSLNRSSPSEIELKVDTGLIDSYRGLLEINPIRKTRLVKVEFTSPNAALSQVIANAHAQTYLRLSFENRFSLTTEAREFLQKKADDLRVRLEHSELAASRFRREHGVVSVEKGENIVVDRLVELNKQLTVARTQRIEAEALYRTVENKKHQDLVEILKHGLVLQLKGNVAALEGEKNRLSTIFKGEHPRIQELGQQITAARLALDNEIANVVRGIQSTYAAALAKERALEVEAEKQQNDALRMRELGVEYAVLQGEVNANRSVHDSVLKRLNETNVSNDVSISNIQIVEQAGKPLNPSSPNVPLFILGSMTLGLLLGIGVAFLQEYFDSTVSTPEIVQRSLGLHTFGVVPDFKFLNNRSSRNSHTELDHSRAGRGDLEMTLNSQPLSIVGDSYRAIRTSLLRVPAENPPQVVLITSAQSGEGKTTTIVNLSIALAQNGYPVIVVDADLRRGRCHTRLGLQNDTGLSDVLTARSTLHEAIQRTSIDGLSLLSRGTVNINPTDLLDSLQMREILQELRHTFKFILLDAPPVIVVNDAAVLSATSDGVLLVLDGEKTSKPSAQRALQRLESLRSPLLGVILNRVNLDDPHYSYFRDYESYYAHEPNNGDSVKEARTKGSPKTAFKFNTISRFAQLWSEQGTQDERRSTKKPATNGANEELKADIFESTQIPRNLAGNHKAFMAETAVTKTEHIVDKKPPESTIEAEVLPQESLNRLIAAVAKSIGPIASVIVHEQMVILGESSDAFPKRRVGELVKLLQQEITDITKRSQL